MRKWLKSKENRKISRVIFFLIFVLLIQIASSYFFNNKLYELSLEHTIDQVDELSEQVKKNLQSELEHNILTLKIMKKHLEQQDDLHSPKTMEMMRETRLLSHFQLVGLANLQGKGIDSSGDVHDIPYHHVQASMESDDNAYISNVFQNENEVFIFVALPFRIKGEVQGIIWGKLPAKEIVENIELDTITYKYFHIIDDKGNYLLSSNSKFALGHGGRYAYKNFWDKMADHHYKNGMSADKIHASVNRGESGYFYFERDGQGRYASYRPLKINNWYLFTVQVQDEMLSYVNHIRSLAVYFFILLAIGFLLVFGSVYHLIYNMYRNIAKQHHDMQSINTMLQAILLKTGNTPFIVDRTAKQVIVYNYPTKDSIKYCAFSEITPEILLHSGAISPDSFEAYSRTFQSVITEGKECTPVVISSRMGDKQAWVRVSIIPNTETQLGQMIGVLEEYSEQIQKDMQIQMHLDDIKKIEEKSQMDFLTQLYNREAFIERVQLALKETMEHHKTSAFLILDLDHFKEINDCMGHAMGDLVLQETAHTLRTFFRKDDIVGRLGGDEFVIFAQYVQDIYAFDERLQQLTNLLCKTYEKDGHQIQISASIGIALTATEHTCFAELYEEADQALYYVKQTGRNNYHFNH